MKSTRYLKYAFGEIFLVMIGILLALGINNWNEQRKENKKERIYLANLKRDLTNQLDVVKAHQETELGYAETSKKIIINYNQEQRFVVDSLFSKMIGGVTGRRTFIRSDPTYAELIATGNIDLIRNAKLKDKVIQYYQFLEKVETIINSNNYNFSDNTFNNAIFEMSRYSLKDWLSSALSSDNLGTFDEILEIDNPRLFRMATQLLSKPENELKFANLIQMRNTQAHIHAQYMRQVRTLTQELITEINAQLP